MGRRLTGWLIAIGLAVFGLHLISVAHYPACWFDEIEIQEIGRFTLFDVFPDWSVIMYASGGEQPGVPAPMFHYLAGAIQEALYRLTGGFVTARVLYLFSLPCCALALFGWLRTRAVGVRTAFLAALLLLVDPNATICAHWYRPDLWCLTAAFGVMTLLANTEGVTERRRAANCLAAGALTAVMLGYWITSMLLLPLIAWDALSRRPKRLGRDLALAAAGFAAALAVILAPLLPHVKAMIAQYADHSELGGGMERGFTAKRFADFAKIAMRSPFVWAAALVGLVGSWKRKLVGFAVIFVALAALMLSTNVYHLRMVYLMPLLFLLITPVVERLPKPVLALALAGYFAISVVAVEYAALPGGNTQAWLVRELAKAVRRPNANVYLYDIEHELYHAARELGWKPFSFTERKTIFEPARSGGLIDRIDAILVVKPLEDELDEAAKQAMAAHGFVRTGELAKPVDPAGMPLKGALQRLFYAHGYPGVIVYQRKGE